MARAWLLFVVLGVLLLVMALASVAWGEGVSWLQIVLGMALIAIGISRRRASGEG